MNYGEQTRSQQLALVDQRQKVRRYFSNSNALESVMADIADGTKVTDIARRLNVSYHAMYSVLNSTYKEQYKAARAAFAEILAEKNLAMADKVESLEMPHDAAKAAAGLRQWHMERTAGEQWGQKSSVDVTHRGVVGLHLEAIRQLSEEPLEGEYAEAEEVETEVGDLSLPDNSDDVADSGDADDCGGDADSETDPDVSEHPLL